MNRPQRRTEADAPGSTIFFSELVAIVAKRSGEPQYLVARILRALAETIYEALQHQKTVQWFGFGRFDVIHRRIRTVPHPADTTRTTTVGGASPRFRPGSAMRRAVNPGVAHDNKGDNGASDGR